MIGILIVTHGKLGDSMIDTAEFILDEKMEFISSVSIDLNESVDKLMLKITSGIKKVDNKEGVVIFTDMFGGTPSNLSYSFLEEGYVEVISGVNLPVILKAVKDREGKTLGSFAANLEIFGKKSISIASGILRGRE